MHCMYLFYTTVTVVTGHNCLPHLDSCKSLAFHRKIDKLTVCTINSFRHQVGHVVTEMHLSEYYFTSPGHCNQEN